MEKVIITIRGGVAEVTEKSDNIEVEIRDYDCDRLTKDEYGDLYVKGTY